MNYWIIKDGNTRYSSLLRKIYQLTVRGVRYNWIHSYPINISQRVIIHNFYLLSEEEVKIGVPQDLILWPTLFIIFINNIDISGPSANKTIEYADASNFVVFSKNIV